MITGVLAIALGVGYLLLVELLDYRGSKFLPAPLEPPAILGSLAGIPGATGAPWRLPFWFIP